MDLKDWTDKKEWKSRKDGKNGMKRIWTVKIVKK